MAHFKLQDFKKTMIFLDSVFDKNAGSIMVEKFDKAANLCFRGICARTLKLNFADNMTKFGKILQSN